MWQHWEGRETTNSTGMHPLEIRKQVNIKTFRYKQTMCSNDFEFCTLKLALKAKPELKKTIKYWNWKCFLKNITQTLRSTLFLSIYFLHFQWQCSDFFMTVSFSLTSLLLCTLIFLLVLVVFSFNSSSPFWCAVEGFWWQGARRAWFPYDRHTEQRTLHQHPEADIHWSHSYDNGFHEFTWCFQSLFLSAGGYHIEPNIACSCRPRPDQHNTSNPAWFWLNNGREKQTHGATAVCQVCGHARGQRSGRLNQEACCSSP